MLYYNTVYSMYSMRYMYIYGNYVYSFYLFEGNGSHDDTGICLTW